MLTDIRIRNFQSLREVDLRLGPLTVIVGASSSGKSAALRALRLLASNARGHAYVTRGKTKATVAAATEAGSVVLERGDGHGVYRVRAGGGAEQQYTKLGGAAPEAVFGVLGLRPAGDGAVSYAGQFDMPYLLDQTGNQVAQVLGELTNVSTIFAAVREANRRRLGLLGQRRLREVDLAEVTRQFAGFTAVPAQLQACVAVEQQLVVVAGQESRVGALRDAVVELETMEAVLVRPLPPAPPSLTDTTGIADRRERLRGLLRDWQGAQQRLDQYEVAGERAARVQAEAEAALHEQLVAGGSCPLCGREFA